MASYKQWFQDKQSAHTTALAEAQATLTQAQNDLEAAQATIAGHTSSVNAATTALAETQAKLDAANQGLALMAEPSLTEEQIDQLYQLQQQTA